MKTKNLRFSVTGTFNGSIVFAGSESEARKLFHEYYNGESIIHLCVYKFIKGKLIKIILQN